MPCKVWVLANAKGELLACQPYGGATTKIADYGLGQGPNVVIGLCEQFGLLPGTKVRTSLFWSAICGRPKNMVPQSCKSKFVLEHTYENKDKPRLENHVVCFWAALPIS